MSSNNGTTPKPTLKGQKHTTTTNTPSSVGDRVKRAKNRHSASVLERFLHTAVKLVTFPIAVVQFLTEPPGSAITSGLGALYMILVSIEGYWQSLNPANPPFLPKPFIDDGASFLRFFTVAIWDWGFWIAATLSLIVQMVQAKVMRDAKTAREAALKAKAEYEEVKHFELEPESENAIEIVRIKRRAYHQAGLKGVRTRGALIVVSYAIDIGIAVWNFPVLAQRGVRLAINVVWSVASVFGAETMICWYQDSLEDAKRWLEKQPKDTEVV